MKKKKKHKGLRCRGSDRIGSIKNELEKNMISKLGYFFFQTVCSKKIKLASLFYYFRLLIDYYSN